MSDELNAADVLRELVAAARESAAARRQEFNDELRRQARVGTVDVPVGEVIPGAEQLKSDALRGADGRFASRNAFNDQLRREAGFATGDDT